MRNDAYVNGKKIGCNQTSAILTDLKKHDGFSFQKDVDSIALQQSLRDLDRGFKIFFEKRARHPQFKSKHNNHPFMEIVTISFCQYKYKKNMGGAQGPTAYDISLKSASGEYKPAISSNADHGTSNMSEPFASTPKLFNTRPIMMRLM